MGFALSARVHRTLPNKLSQSCFIIGVTLFIQFALSLSLTKISYKLKLKLKFIVIGWRRRVHTKRMVSWSTVGRGCLRHIQLKLGVSSDYSVFTV